MSQPLLPYAPPAPLQSPLLLGPPEMVPPTDELEAVQVELRALKQRSLERAKKADGDLRAIESAIRKMREREKGKAKAQPPKVKREPSYTPSLDAEERAFSPSLAAGSTKASSSTGSLPPITVTAVDAKKYKKKDKDKKRKRDTGDSDGEHDAQRPRKFSPHPPSHKETHQYKPSKLSSVVHPKASAGPDWSLPSTSSLLPQRPQLQPPLAPAPRRPIEVTEDFSKARAPQTQVPVGTFYTSIEPWLRPIREEDVGWLEYTADEVEPYVVPELGRHYTEQWEDEDVALYGGVPSVLDFSHHRPTTQPGVPPAVPKWDTSLISESDLVTEKGLGPVTERLVSALLPVNDKLQKSVSQTEDALEARNPPGGAGPSILAGVKDKVLVAEFEERIKDSAKFYGLLDGEPSFSHNLDDPIATALRQAQHQLRIVVATNRAHKARLGDIARDRLAYQEYVEVRESIDKNITALYVKLQKKDGPKIGKKKKKGELNGGPNGVVGTNGVPVPLPNPASLGLGPDEDGALVVPDALRTLVETRCEWVNVIGAAFEEKECDSPGRIRGLPSRSIFEGIEEDVRHELGEGFLGLPWVRSLLANGERTDGSARPGNS